MPILKYPACAFISIFLICSSPLCADEHVAASDTLNKKRIEDVHHIARLAEDYYKIKGYYPLGSGKYKLPVDVYLSSQKLKRSHKSVSHKKLIKNLKSVLGEDIQIPFDPEDDGTMYYQYSTIGYDYSVSALVTENSRFTYPIASDIYKYHVGSLYMPKAKIFRLKDALQIQKNGWAKTPLIKKLNNTIRQDNVAGVSDILQLTKNINPICDYHVNCQPLIIATQLKNIKIMQLLINHGADVNGNNAYNSTPLMKAIETGDYHKDIVELLLKSGADVNQANDFGITSFHGACIMGDEYLFDLFMKHGAKLNIAYYNKTSANKKRDGFTPLMAASWAGKANIVKLLLENGADKNKRDSSGLSAFDYAKQENYQVIMNLLKKKKKKK